MATSANDSVYGEHRDFRNSYYHSIVLKESGMNLTSN